jgi:hypothetical protein
MLAARWRWTTFYLLPTTLHATPREESPFIVRIFGPEIIPPNLWFLGEKHLTVSAVKDPHMTSKIENLDVSFLGIELEMVDCYPNPPANELKYHERRKEWNRFKKNVERLAA